MLTFLSKSLDRVISFDSFSTLSIAELRALYAELFIADLSMTDSMANALGSDSDTNPVDKDWIHRMKKKHRVCLAFLAQVKQLLDAVTVESNLYLSYYKHLNSLLVEELGPTVLKEVENLAKERARADVQLDASCSVQLHAA
jgi:hypothetical protein